MESNTTRKTNKKRPIAFILVILIIVVIIFLLIFALKGKTISTKSEAEENLSEAIMCTSNSAEYPILHDNKQTALELKVNIAILNSAINSIGLTYTATYPDQNSLNSAYILLQSDMNAALFDSGLEFGALNNKWSKYDANLILSLFAEGKELEEKVLKYFLIATPLESSNNVKDYLLLNYEQQNFICKTN